MIRTLICALLATAIVAAPAQAACWRADEVAAAKVRDFDTLLMVSSLRCRMQDPAMVARYNAFVTKNRVPLTQANVVLRTRFVALVGKAAALNAYDRYITKVANRYGAGADGLSCADFASLTDAALAEAPSFAALTALAERASTRPVMDDEACAVTLAARR
ncbi:MAG: hypothetical protein ACKVOP_08510 [Sphingomonadaceae bacterium]